MSTKNFKRNERNAKNSSETKSMIASRRFEDGAVRSDQSCSIIHGLCVIVATLIHALHKISNVSLKEVEYVSLTFKFKIFVMCNSIIFDLLNNIPVPE